MRRPRSHVLEEESWRAFQRAISAEWVARRQNPDYGIDVHVQLFEQGRLSPFSFYVQLKATDAKRRGKRGVKYPFGTEHLRYYLQCPFPVMLAVYSSEERGICCDWVHSLWEAGSAEDRARWHLQRSVSLELRGSLEKTPPETIARDIRRYYYSKGYSEPRITPFVLGFETESSGRARDAQLLRLRALLSQWEYIRLTQDELSDATLSIRYDPERLELRAVDRQEIGLEERTDSDAAWDRMRPTILIGVALLLHMSGRANDALDLVCSAIMSSGRLPRSSLAALSHHTLAELFGAQGREAEALMLAERLVDLGEASAASMLAGVIVYSERGSSYEQSYRRVIARILDTSRDPRWLGHLRYDLGSSLTRSGEYRAAIRQYRLAVSEDPNYVQHAYWWSGLGHCLCCCGRYRMAELCYRTAIDLDQSETAHLADLSYALLFQGRLGEAEESLSKYLSATEEPTPTSVLTSFLISHLEQQQGGDFARAQSAANQLVKQAMAVEPSQRVPILNEAVHYDPLCGQARCMLAGENPGGYADACLEWVVAATLLPQSGHAWATAVATLWATVSDAMQGADWRELQDAASKLADLLVAALCTGFGVCGCSFPEMVADQFPGLSDEERSNLKHSLVELAGKGAHIFPHGPKSGYRIDTGEGPMLEFPVG